MPTSACGGCEATRFILVPGQVLTSDILDFMSALDTRKIHGCLLEYEFECSPGRRCRTLGTISVGRFKRRWLGRSGGSPVLGVRPGRRGPPDGKECAGH